MCLVVLSDSPFNMKGGGSSRPGLHPRGAETFIHLQKQVNTTSSSAPDGHPQTCISNVDHIGARTIMNENICVE